MSAPIVDHEKTTDNTANPITNDAPVAGGSEPAVAEKKARNFDKGFETEHETAAVKVDMSTIQLTSDDLYDKDKVDLEQVSLDDVWTLLQ